MKYIKLFFILILIVSCSNEKQISEFENVLGKENSKTLTYLVSDFENDFLKRNYPDLNTEQAYHKFLNELENNTTGNWKKTSKKSRKVFDNSNLKLQVYGIPDSVWIERNPDTLSLNNSVPRVKTRRKFLKQDGTYWIGMSESSFNDLKSQSDDSIIKLYKKYNEINYYGKYRAALKSVAGQSDFIKEYLDMTEAAGILDPRLIAAEILNKNVDVSDYFVKRLIVTEIIY
ncbi:hypothetical protein D1818_05555 [Aquimarina sp. BL5]|uniref:hypothetical protein n=1 Tax=Aquimarina sp. BL5 TaxID=1714860 RepID=UPI000E4A74C5|nr:hypothetical protein [Aquimarina sp. BL5]AXT50320.1 hypothetical protein D1818_05555 [Aquimarina sp. BL5]RKM93063.1 hypothetical protein D7036_22450 [Aquimarina sp. BL5]